ncbi:MAG: element excision factor XisH family protein [Byssovorax sp.]
MPARDLLQPIVRRALEREGWEITDDPFRLVVGRRSMYVDLGAEQLLAATRGSVRIAVEVKSFVGTSEIADLESALGQFSLYERVLRKNHPERTLWLAVPSRVWAGLFREALGELLLADGDLRILVVEPTLEIIEQWIPSPPGATLSSKS